MVNRVNNAVNRQNKPTSEYIQDLTSYIETKRNNRQTEDIWFNDISVLFNAAYVFEIMPTTTMTLGEKINAITRFAFFLSMLLTLVKQNYIYIYVFIVPVIITYIVYIFSPNTREFFNIQPNNVNANNVNANNVNANNVNANNVIHNSVKGCQAPTNDNPMMNILPTDNFQSRKIACDVTDPLIAKDIGNKITDTYTDKLYCDTTNIMNRNIGERDFYTMPNTRIPNDQGTFAKWLYETPISCAIGSGDLIQHKACAFNNKTLSELKTDFANLPDDIEANNGFNDITNNGNGNGFNGDNGFDNGSNNGSNSNGL
jgi:hypothetical protein